MKPNNTSTPIWEYGTKDSKQSDELSSFVAGFEPLRDLLTRNDTRLLELGCGTAPFGRRLLDDYPRLSAWGADIDGKRIACLQAIIERDGLAARYHAQIASVLDSNLFEDEFFDAVLCPMMLHHFIRLHETTLPGNILRWLKRGGFLVVYEPNGSNPVSWVSSMLVLGFVRMFPRFAPGLKDPDETVHTIPYYRNTFTLAGFEWLGMRRGHTAFEWERSRPLLVNLRNVVVKLAHFLTWGNCRGTVQMQMFRRARREENSRL